MTIIANREQRRQMKRENAKQPAVMKLVPLEKWPMTFRPPGIHSVWRSRNFLAQLYTHETVPRLSINRVALNGDRWEDGITWDELMRVKRECGFADVWAVECFPPDREVVNVANQRHLWLIGNESPAFGWARRKGEK